jgi:NADPH-dependent 2,4-dienoyl-CoA reductase/sulfur reductase-like enzyme/ferredoxin
LGAWRALRIASLLTTLGVAALLLAAPDTGLKIFWGVAIPLLPLLFFVAPGLWRNICPLAAANQMPRTLGFTRGLTAPDWLKQYGYVVAIAAVTIFISLRTVVFEDSGLATALLLLGALAAAFVGGLLLKGKSGWCTSLCPLLPVQRLYNETPFALVPNTHCQPCVGCTKNCYDFNPRVANLADLGDPDHHYVGARKFFAGAFPGLVLAYFTVDGPPDRSALEMFGLFGVYLLTSAGSFYVLDSFVKVSSHKIRALYAAIALNIFYGFGAPRLVETLSGEPTPAWLDWLMLGIVFGLTAIWLIRTFRKESIFKEESAPPPSISGRSLSMTHSLATMKALQAGSHEVTFEPDDKHVVAKPGTTLLEAAEATGLPIEAGCRMAVCGADPVAIKDGMDNLGPIGDDERSTLDRLGYAENTRLACAARVMGKVCVSLEPERPARPTSSQIADYDFDRDVERVVVLGNGIAGVTAADHVRRRHPLCAIDLVADEPYHLYNRMGIARLIYGRSAMQGLQLLPDTWYDDNAITTWLNTRARRIDREAREVELASGETLPYDRLILTAGSTGRVPPIGGFGVPGTFVLRSADDALRIRSYSQQHECLNATVAGGGLLGLEAAYALHKLGMRATVVEAAERLMLHQLDDRASEILRDYLEGLGLQILLGSSIAEVTGKERVRAVTLADGDTLPTDLFLVCAGIAPNVRLARDAGLEVERGVVVDDRMRTSDPAIFAAGDVAEHRGELHGLWPTAVGQAEVAADNVVGGSKEYTGAKPVTVLKVVGIELTSVGRFQPQEGDEVIALEEDEGQRYRKLVISDDRIVGAILLGYSQEVSPTRTAITRELDVSSAREDLRAGDWEVLDELAGDEALLPAAAARPGSG